MPRFFAYVILNLGNKNNIFKRGNQMSDVHSIFMRSILWSIVFLLNFQGSSFGGENCKQSHCSEINAILNSFCINAGFAGKQYLVLDAGVACYCPCSCVTGDTKIQLGDVNFFEELQIADLETGMEVQTPMSTQLPSISVYKVLRSPMEGEILEVVLEDDFRLKASKNHVFLNEKDQTVSGKQLKMGDFLQTKLGPKKVVAINTIWYTGTLHNLIVNENSTTVADHVISTNGIFSGDWLLQVNHDAMNTSLMLRNDLVEMYQ